MSQLQDSLSTHPTLDHPSVTPLPVQPVTTALPRRIAQAISRLLLDTPRERTARFYGDVQRLDIVGVAGTTSRAYGVAWDAELRPHWEFPSAQHQPHAIGVVTCEDGAGNGRGILADQQYRAEPQANSLVRRIGAKAA